MQMENAQVAMPIRSTHELTANGKSLLYNEHDGYIIHPQGKHTSKFLGAHGVYFLKMLVPKKYTRARPEDPHPQTKGFGRQD